MAKKKDLKKLKQRIKDKKAVKSDGKACSLKALGQYSTAAKCDVPKQCQTCSWYQTKEQIEERKKSITRWKKMGF